MVWVKGTKFSEDHKRKLGESHRHKYKIVESPPEGKKRGPPGPKKGTPSPLKGRKLTAEHRQYIGESLRKVARMKRKKANHTFECLLCGVEVPILEAEEHRATCPKTGRSHVGISLLDH
jgi:hypothetical protein